MWPGEASALLSCHVSLCSTFSLSIFIFARLLRFHVNSWARWQNWAQHIEEQWTFRSLVIALLRQASHYKIQFLSWNLCNAVIFAFHDFILHFLLRRNLGRSIYYRICVRGKWPWFTLRRPSNHDNRFERHDFSYPGAYYNVTININHRATSELIRNEFAAVVQVHGRFLSRWVAWPYPGRTQPNLYAILHLKPYFLLICYCRWFIFKISYRSLSCLAWFIRGSGCKVI